MWKYFKLPYWRKLYFKIVKQEGTPESLAMGLAIGVFAGFIVPTGGQIAVALALAFWFKSNKVLAVMGTMITNPYTATFFIPSECWVGAIIMGSPLEFSVISSEFNKLMEEPSWSNLMTLGGQFLIPLLIGGVVYSIIFSIPTYYLTLAWVKAHRRRKHERMQKRSAVQAASLSTRTIMPDGVPASPKASGEGDSAP